MDQFSNTQRTPPPYVPPVPDANEQKLIEAKETVAFLKGSNIPLSHIYDVLIKRGIDHTTATNLIDTVAPETPVKRNQRQSGINNIVIGLVLIVAGIFFSVLSYNSVSESGGHYFVLYGPVVAGIVLFFKGISQL